MTGMMTTRIRINGKHIRFGTSVNFHTNIGISFDSIFISVRLRIKETMSDTTADHMKYLPGMDIIESDVCEHVMKEMKSYVIPTASSMASSLLLTSIDVMTVFAKFISPISPSIIATTAPTTSNILLNPEYSLMTLSLES